MIKILDKSNFDAVNSKFQINNLAFQNYFLNDDEQQHQCYGYFFNDELISIFSVVDSLEIPAWILSKNNSFFNFNNLENFLVEIIPIKESQNRLQFFTLMDLDEFSHYSKILPRYQPYIEYKLSPGSYTEHENINHDILEYKTYNNDMLIILWVLKNEYRTDKK